MATSSTSLSSNVLSSTVLLPTLPAPDVSSPIPASGATTPCPSTPRDRTIQTIVEGATSAGGRVELAPGNGNSTVGDDVLGVSGPIPSAVVGEVEKKSNEPNAEPGTQVDDEARELLLEALDWFHVPYHIFSAPDWGDSWKTLLEAFVKLEGSVEFAVAHGNLRPNGRPAILSEWVADGRLKPRKGGHAVKKMILLKAKDVAVFKALFIRWWDSMQPPWRKQDREGNWLRTRHGRDFGGLDVWGQNGWLSVVACLYWW